MTQPNERYSSLLRACKEGMVKSFYPECVENSDEFEEKLNGIMYDFDGVLRLGPSSSPALVEMVKAFKPRKGDFLIATYPRSGQYT